MNFWMQHHRIVSVWISIKLMQDYHMHNGPQIILRSFEENARKQDKSNRRYFGNIIMLFSSNAVCYFKIDDNRRDKRILKIVDNLAGRGKIKLTTSIRTKIQEAKGSCICLKTLANRSKWKFRSSRTDEYVEQHRPNIRNTHHTISEWTCERAISTTENGNMNDIEIDSCRRQKFLFNLHRDRWKQEYNF